MKLDLLTNATVVDDAIRFVSDHEKTTKKSDKIGSTTGGVDTQEEEGYYFCNNTGNKSSISRIRDDISDNQRIRILERLIRLTNTLKRDNHDTARIETVMGLLN
jgi:hypothetical protein